MRLGDQGQKYYQIRGHFYADCYTVIVCVPSTAHLRPMAVHNLSSNENIQLVLQWKCSISPPMVARYFT